MVHRESGHAMVEYAFILAMLVLTVMASAGRLGQLIHYEYLHTTGGFCLAMAGGTGGDAGPFAACSNNGNGDAGAGGGGGGGGTGNCSGNSCED